MHPLVNDLSSLKDSELDAKISDLTRKYFMTANPGVQAQMVAILDSYKEELAKRQKAALDKVMSNKGLDKLIKVN
jgi:hypothetical protein